MDEIFQVIFNSQGSNVLTATNNAAARVSISYNVNWASFLPQNYKKFRCQFIFKSMNYAPAGNFSLVDNGFVNMNIGRMNIYDGLQQTQNLGIVYPVILSTTAGAYCSYYNTTNNDNNDFWIDYPVNNIITITLKTFAGTDMGNMPHYTLILNLMAVDI